MGYEIDRANKGNRAGRMLPKNFEKIPISKLQQDKLAALGIEYNPRTGQRRDAISPSDDE